MSLRVVRGELVRVVDGDTAHFIISAGWGILLMPQLGKDPGPGTVRLVFQDGSKWDAPDRDTLNERLLAKAALSELLTVGQKYTIVSYGIDVHRRTIGAVSLPDGRDVAAVMHSLGHTKKGT